MPLGSLLPLRLRFEGPLCPKANPSVTKAQYLASAWEQERHGLPRETLRAHCSPLPVSPIPWLRRSGRDRNEAAPGLLDSPASSDMGCTGVGRVSSLPPENTR